MSWKVNISKANLNDAIPHLGSAGLLFHLATVATATLGIDTEPKYIITKEGPNGAGLATVCGNMPPSISVVTSMSFDDNIREVWANTHGEVTHRFYDNGDIITVCRKINELPQVKAIIEMTTALKARLSLFLYGRGNEVYDISDIPLVTPTLILGMSDLTPNELEDIKPEEVLKVAQWTIFSMVGDVPDLHFSSLLSGVTKEELNARFELLKKEQETWAPIS